MNISDPVSDLLTRIRNAQKAGHESVAIPASKMKIAIANILKEEGFVRNLKCIRDNKQGVLKIALKYDENGRGAISEIQRVSKPGCRVYITSDKIPFVRNGFGITVLSTSRGVLSGRSAKAAGLGGELICTAY